MSELKIEYVSIDDLKPYENNAKIHTKEQIEQIKKSIEEFGFNDPIAVWHDEIVEGHGRLIAAQKLGLKELPIIRLDNLTDEQRRAYTIVHNQLNINTGFDIEKLNEDIFSMPEFDWFDFGIDVGYDINDFGTEFTLPTGEPTQKTMTLHFSPIQFEIVSKILDQIEINPGEGGGNKQANKIAKVVTEWQELKKLNFE